MNHSDPFLMFCTMSTAGARTKARTAFMRLGFPTERIAIRDLYPLLVILGNFRMYSSAIPLIPNNDFIFKLRSRFTPVKLLSYPANSLLEEHDSTSMCPVIPSTTIHASKHPK